MALLLVDDSPDDIRLVEWYLKSAGYKVVSVNSAEEALRYLTGHGEGEPLALIDLILLDVKLPGIDGIDACKQIKAMKQFEEVPILMVSVDTTVGTIQLAFRRGAADYIRKPVIKAELLAKVAMVLKLREDAKSGKATRTMIVQNESVQVPVKIDVLTGIINWWGFEEAFEHGWERAARARLPISLIFFRLEDFKPFNDKYGYQTGDECLQIIAQAAQKTFAQPGQVVARYRGAEFVVMLWGTAANIAETMADRLLEAIEALDLGPTVAVGVATAYPDEQTTREALLTLAKSDLVNRK